MEPLLGIKSKYGIQPGYTPLVYDRVYIIDIPSFKKGYK